MKPVVFVDGDQGTTGLQILSRLASRTDFALLTLPPERRKDPHWRAQAINDCAIAILCLPDTAAREAVASVRNPRVRIIDASSAHRLAAGWTYGFPEMDAGHPARIAGAGRVSNPGCYPTGAIALLRPLVRAGLLDSGHPLAIHAISGYSGAGRAGIEAYESNDAQAGPAFRVYGLALTHKHTPEIQRWAGLARRPLFVPAYGAFRQGIVLTIGLHTDLLPAGTDGACLRECLIAHYAHDADIEVMAPADPAGLDSLDPQALNGSNRLGLSVFDNRDHGQILLAAVFDNLGKGASGAAVQNLDLMLAGQP